MQQNYRFNIDGWLLIWKVQNALFCETSNMTFHEGSLKNNFGPWKVLEKRFQFSVRTLVSWKVFLSLFGCPIQNIIHSSETLKVIFITRFLFYAIINILRQVSWKKVEKLVEQTVQPLESCYNGLEMCNFLHSVKSRWFLKIECGPWKVLKKCLQFLYEPCIPVFCFGCSNCSLTIEWDTSFNGCFTACNSNVGMYERVTSNPH